MNIQFGTIALKYLFLRPLFHCCNINFYHFYSKLIFKQCSMVSRLSHHAALFDNESCTKCVGTCKSVKACGPVCVCVCISLPVCVNAGVCVYAYLCLRACVGLVFLSASISYRTHNECFVFILSREHYTSL